MSWIINMLGGALRLTLTALIYFYQWFVSPLLRANCRHLPSCSKYAIDALETHGLLRGSYFTLKRILRCHPWTDPMLDPVPPKSNKQPFTSKLKG